MLKTITFISALILLTNISHAADIDAELNKTYKDVLSQYNDDAEFKQLIIKSQRAWLKSLNQSCDFFTDLRGNDTDMSNACITTQKQGRVNFFKEILSH